MRFNAINMEISRSLNAKGGTRSLLIRLSPQWRDVIELTTGEIVGLRRGKRNDKEVVISEVGFRVRRKSDSERAGAAGPNAIGIIQYIGAYELGDGLTEPVSIEILVYMEDIEFDELSGACMKNISAQEFSFEIEGMGYGSAPDGLVRTWDNKTRTNLQILELRWTTRMAETNIVEPDTP